METNLFFGVNTLSLAVLRKTFERTQVGVAAFDANGRCLASEPGEESLVLEMVAVHCEGHTDQWITYLQTNVTTILWRARNAPCRDNVIDERIAVPL